jgi:hypothetical protein
MMTPSPLAPESRTGRTSIQCGTPGLRPQPSRWRVAAALVLPALLLASCGGSADDSDPPQVAMAVTPTSAAAGASVTLLALATDDESVTEVRFYRVVGTGNVVLGSLFAQPYQLTVTLPSDATDSVSFFARAFDEDDNETNSATVTVTIPD